MIWVVGSMLKVPVTITVMLEGSGIQSDPSRTNPDGHVIGLQTSTPGT